MAKTELKDKTYVLRRSEFPIAFMLASRNTRNKPLLYFDESTGTNRALRYAVNQRSPFEDEQDGNFILEPIVFEDGVLTVSRTNVVLQKFLEFHPDNGSIFEELDVIKDANEQIDYMELALDAQVAVKNLDINSLESLARVLIGGRIDRMTTAEIKRDLLIFARNNPERVLDLLNDPQLRLRNVAAKALHSSMFIFKNNKRDIYYNLPDNKKKLLTIPFGEQPVDAFAAFLQSDEGIDLYKMLENRFNS